ncbi:MAG TPA: enoyl-CoA hydratase/isomerase family protein [Baekduia sp.]
MLSYRSDGAVAYATLDRPEKLNAMTREFWAELRAVVARAEADDDVRVLIFHGAGRCFSVGGDIAAFGDLGDAADKRAYLGEAFEALRAVEALSKPTIAAVHGHAVGGGCELTMVCDVVVADETARFGTPETSVGLVPGPGVARGSAHLNLHWLKFMVLTGETLDAREAQLAGLVNRVVAPGEHLATAEALAATMATRAPLAQAVGKALLNARFPDAWPAARDAVAYLQGTDDFDEGIAAFTQRRDPRFEGR